eukprot:3774648-Prorocentrum_lima.AAC.1
MLIKEVKLNHKGLSVGRSTPFSPENQGDLYCPAQLARSNYYLTVLQKWNIHEGKRSKHKG